jgi:protein-S-isoprenylcysteine O-methyltransferase Ste14
VSVDSWEKWLRRAAGLGFVAFVVVVFQGLARSQRRAKGRSGGPAVQTLGTLRASYVPMSVLAVGFLYKIWRPLPLSLGAPARLVASLLGVLLYFPGLALFLWGRRTMGEMYDLSSSLGVQLYADHKLVTTGPFALVRHPLYLGGIIAELGALLIFRNWAMLLVALNAPALVLRGRREEEVLAAEFGEQWAEYKQRTPMLLPQLRIR